MGGGGGGVGGRGGVKNGSGWMFIEELKFLGKFTKKKYFFLGGGEGRGGVGFGWGGGHGGCE